MPKASRVVCRTCGAQLGIVLNDRLSIAGHQVEYAPRAGLTIICTACRTPRPWQDRHTA